jgi:hypothetical protein
MLNGISSDFISNVIVTMHLVNGQEGLLGSSLALHVPVHLQKSSMSFSVIALKISPTCDLVITSGVHAGPDSPGP